MMHMHGAGDEAFLELKGIYIMQNKERVACEQLFAENHRGMDYSLPRGTGTSVAMFTCA